MCDFVRKGFGGLTLATKPWRLNARRTVSADTAGKPRLQAWRATSAADRHSPDMMRCLMICSSRVVSLREAPRRCWSLRLDRPQKARRKRLTEVRRLPIRQAIDESESPTSCNANILARKGSENLMVPELGASGCAACLTASSGAAVAGRARRECCHCGARILRPAT